MYRFEQQQLIKADLDQVWKFFSNPRNLQKLMPEDMGFQTIDEVPESMYPGLLLRYKVAPLMGIKLPWTSRIEFIEDRKYFVDTQSEGPFRYWHHEHRFEETEEGTMAIDILHYRLPLEPLSKLFHGSIVKKKLDIIFQTRISKTSDIFGG
jgi:ligand-binding SRPBCC domain-containing protein